MQSRSYKTRRNYEKSIKKTKIETYKKKIKFYRNKIECYIDEIDDCVESCDYYKEKLKTIQKSI